MDDLMGRIQQLEQRLEKMERQLEGHQRVIYGEWPTGTPALIERFEQIATRLDNIQTGIVSQVARLEMHRQRAIWVLIGYGILVIGGLVATATAVAQGAG